MQCEEANQKKSKKSSVNSHNSSSDIAQSTEYQTLW